MPETHHILFSKAFTYPVVDSDLTPAGATYDSSLGAWVIRGHTPLLFIEATDRRPPATKKMDLETGEDHKGA